MVASIRRLVVLVWVGVGSQAAPTVRAEGIWQWSQEATGSAFAQVVGGDGDSDTFVLEDPVDPSFNFGAFDQTQPGSFGAGATGSGSVSFRFPRADNLLISVDAAASYLPTAFPGGDNPGGEADVALFSVIDLVVPDDATMFGHNLRINQDATDVFTGSALFTIENMTQSTLIQEYSTSGVSGGFSPLGANAGDIIRITSSIEADGDTGGPDGARFYIVDMGIEFRVPEPSTVLFLAVGSLLLLRRVNA